MSLLSPMISQEELSLLEKYINKEDVLCEYGSGGSTRWFSQRVERVYSIEHNEEWFKKTSDSLIDCSNAHLQHVPNSPSWDPSTEGSYKEFMNYVNFPENLNVKFSFFFVDGRARVDCCRFISEKFPEATVAFHDYTNRAYDAEHNYARALNYLRLVETAGTLAIFKSK